MTTQTMPSTEQITHDGLILKDVIDDILYKLDNSSGITINVKDYGALGDYNPSTGGGQSSASTDAAVAAAIAALGTAYFEQGGVLNLHFPAGHYLLGSVTIPAALVAGLNITGDGMFSSFIWSDQTNPNPTFFSEIGFNRFESLFLVGSKTRSSNIANWKTAFFECKLADKTADVDVAFHNCYMGYSVDFIKCHGRGVVIDPSCVCVYNNYLLNIVCDTDTVWNATDTGKQTTGMRHYNISPGRCDVVSQFFRVTGTGAQKDHINDILINCTDVLSMDRICTFDDATLSRMTVNCGVGLNSFSGPPFVGKRMIDCTINMVTAKQYDRNVASTNTMWGIVQLTGPFNGLRITGNYYQLRGFAVQIGAASAGLVIDIDVQSLNYLPVGDGNFVAVRGADVNGQDIRIMTSGLAPAAGTLFFFSEATQSSPSFRCYSNNNTFKKPVVVGSAPILYMGGVAQTPSIARREMQLINGDLYCNDYYAYTRAGTSGSTIKMSLQSVPLSDNTLSSLFVGDVKIMNSTISIPLFAKINNSNNRIEFFKSSGAELLESDLPATFAISLSVRYKFQ